MIKKAGESVATLFIMAAALYCISCGEQTPKKDSSTLFSREPDRTNPKPLPGDPPILIGDGSFYVQSPQYALKDWVKVDGKKKIRHPQQANHLESIRVELTPYTDPRLPCPIGAQCWNYGCKDSPRDCVMTVSYDNPTSSIEIRVKGNKTTLQLSDNQEFNGSDNSDTLTYWKDGKISRIDAQQPVTCGATPCRVLLYYY